MLWWDNKFLELTENIGIGIDMYKRFIDDANLVSDVIDAGWEFSGETKNLIYNEERVLPDSLLSDDKRTALVVKSVANSIHPIIQMDEDVPTNHENEKVPILDLEC